MITYYALFSELISKKLGLLFKQMGPLLEIATGRNQVAIEGLNVQSGGQVVTLPGIGDLQSKAEGFLQSAKLRNRRDR